MATVPTDEKKKKADNQSAFSGHHYASVEADKAFCRTSVN